MIRTCFCYVKWDTRNPHNVVHGAQHRIAVDTQLLTQKFDPMNGIRNHPEIKRAMHLAADKLAGYLQRRLANHNSRPIPLSREGALYVIEKLRGQQPKNKLMKMRKIVDEIDWADIERNGFAAVPKTSTSIFIKNESYPDKVKAPRLICFPAEGEKLIMTMAFFHIMHPMFSSPFCTKEISEHLRPKTIERRLEGTGRKFVADYTSFECCANRDIMRAGEHRVLRQLVSPEYHFVFPWIEAGGKLRHRSGVTIKTSAIQYSGRYTTSLSNTIRNKLFMDCVALDNGLDIEEYRGVFEGDDSLTGWPRSITKQDLERSLAKLGVAAEIDEYEEVGKAGYCSTYWNEDHELVCEPIKVLASFPFTTSQLAANVCNYRPLLAAKAMSLAYRAPGCPIISAVVRRYIGACGYMETRNDYERRWYSQFSRVVRANSGKKSMRIEFKDWDLVKEPTLRQRELFSEIFGISIPNQVAAEKLILTEDGFSETLLALLEEGQLKAGVKLNELQDVYYTMREHARFF